jgi:hypothetical protein
MGKMAMMIMRRRRSIFLPLAMAKLDSESC